MRVAPHGPAWPVYAAEAPGPSPLSPTAPASAGGADHQSFDHTLYPDISQYNHFSISNPRNFVITMMYDHGEPFRSYMTATSRLEAIYVVLARVT
jgi:hypothetical protein